MLREPTVAAGRKRSDEPKVGSDYDKVEITLYGQVDREVLFVADGRQGDAMDVDNTKSSTRFGIKGRVRPSGDQLR